VGLPVIPAQATRRRESTASPAVIPAKAGTQRLRFLNSGVRRNDKASRRTSPLRLAVHELRGLAAVQTAGADDGVAVLAPPFLAFLLDLGALELERPVLGAHLVALARVQPERDHALPASRLLAVLHLVHLALLGQAGAVGEGPPQQGRGEGQQHQPPVPLRDDPDLGELEPDQRDAQQHEKHVSKPPAALSAAAFGTAPSTAA